MSTCQDLYCENFRMFIPVIECIGKGFRLVWCAVDWGPCENYTWQPKLHIGIGQKHVRTLVQVIPKSKIRVYFSKHRLLPPPPHPPAMQYTTQQHGSTTPVHKWICMCYQFSNMAEFFVISPDSRSRFLWYYRSDLTRSLSKVKSECREWQESAIAQPLFFLLSTQFLTSDYNIVLFSLEGEETQLVWQFSTTPWLAKTRVTAPRREGLVIVSICS